MTADRVRISIITLTSFLALTTIGGGLALLTGLEEFPIEWLDGTPFNNYMIPAVILIVAVGGSSSFAVIALLTRSKIEVFATITAGIMMTGYILTEVLILNQSPPGPTLIEGIYFLLGALIFVLGILLIRIRYKESS